MTYLTVTFPNNSLFLNTFFILKKIELKLLKLEIEAKGNYPRGRSNSINNRSDSSRRTGYSSFGIHSIIFRSELRPYKWLLNTVAELAYFIDKGYEGKGMMSEGFEAILEELFVKHHFEKLSLHMATNNSRSLKLAETHGFMRDGLHRKRFRNYYSELIDIYSYGILKTEYFK